MPRRPSRRASESDPEDMFNNFTSISRVTTRSKIAPDNNNNNTDDVSHSASEPINPMKASLDYGDLRVRDSDRKFTNFLDLKRRYHHTFLESLCLHAQARSGAGNGYATEVLLSDEETRRVCAMDFLRKYGMFYWGTEENRKKYLVPERLAKPDELTIYPEREEEIARTIMILLEKKAKKGWKSQKKASASDDCLWHRAMVDLTQEIEPLEVEKHSKRSLHTPPPPDPEPGITYGPGSKGHDTPGSAKKNTMGRSERTTVHPGQGSPLGYRTPEHRSNPSIQRFSEATLDFESVPEIANDKKRKRRSTTPGEGNRESILKDHHSGSVARGTPKTSLEKGHEHKTKFLVHSTTSAQEGMAPVWVPYQHFDSASDFLSLMVDECQNPDWDPSVQLSHEANGDPTQRLSALGVLAASISFEWTEAKIRVRPGVDRDWAFVLQTLQKAWAGKGEGGALDPDEFRIGVKLHVA